MRFFQSLLSVILSWIGYQPKAISQIQVHQKLIGSGWVISAVNRKLIFSVSGEEEGEEYEACWETSVFGWISITSSPQVGTEISYDGTVYTFPHTAMSIRIRLEGNGWISFKNEEGTMRLESVSMPKEDRRA